MQDVIFREGNIRTEGVKCGSERRVPDLCRWHNSGVIGVILTCWGDEERTCKNYWQKEAKFSRILNAKDISRGAKIRL